MDATTNRVLEEIRDRLNAHPLSELRGKIGHGRVPIGLHRIKITVDKPKEPGKNVGFIVRSVEARKGKLKVVKKGPDWVVIEGEAGALSGLVNSLGSLDFPGEVSDA